MVELNSVLAWVAIGMAASLAGMIWPFQRGVVGVLVNFAAGIGGAIVLALLSYAVLPQSRDPFTITRLLFAAVGSIVALWVTHVVWLRAASRRRHTMESPGAHGLSR